VAGAIVDSDDAPWLPVTDVETGVSGYVSLEFVLPPERMDQTGLRSCQTLVTTAPLRLRGVPETFSAAEPALPIGTPLQISAITISSGILWVSVGGPSSDGIKWVPWDLLLSATAASSSHEAASAFVPGQRVAVTSDDVNFREPPRFDADMIDQLNEGHQLEITGPSIVVDGAIWYPVRDPEGMEGFIVAEFLAASDPAPVPTRTPISTPTA